MLETGATKQEFNNNAKVFLESLTHLRDEWVNEIPEETVQTSIFKVRKAWFEAIILNLYRIGQQGYLTDETQIRAKEFMDEFTSASFERPTTAEDIQKGNNILTLAIKDLEQFV